MVDTFDPYHVWLGIPADEQPPNFYRLLGVPLFEEKLDAIAAAADQRMGHLRTFQLGKHGRQAAELLNQVAAARVCLLNEEKKAAYDQELRQALQAEVKDLPKARAGKQVARGVHTQETMAYVPESDEPKQLGEYELLEKLGEGGMGTVYKAMHTKLGREVALKVLSKHRLEDEQAIARFEREMRAVGRLDHANVVRAMDAREIEGTCFLVMEYVDGLDLNDVVRRGGPLSVSNACEVIRQAALGLQSAHEHGLVHRDVKPSNLMLDHQGQVKLLDLGLARFRSERAAGEEVTGTGQALGTADYMAPEQISDTRAADIRADVYSLGCTLYKLLAGRAPFAGKADQTELERLMAHVSKPPPSIQKARKDVPKELAHVVNRMLAKAPDDRYQTPAEVADAVGPLASGCDLPKLLAMATGELPPAPPIRALETTKGSSSSGLTRFLQGLKGEQRTGADEEPPAAEQGLSRKQAIMLGAAGVGVLLLILLVWAFSSGGGPAPGGPAKMAFDWPHSEEITLLIDGRPFDWPNSGPLKIPCKPGNYRIRAEREGFLTHKEEVTVGTGQQFSVTQPVWVPEPTKPSHLVLLWPENERGGARVEIDRKEIDLSKADKSTPAQLKLPVKPGEHNVWIGRPKFEPWEDKFAVVEGKDETLTPVWIPIETEEDEQSPPVPTNAEQDQLRTQIDKEYRLAEAKAGAEKVERAEKLFGDASNKDMDHKKRFVLLRMASELAADGGQATVVLGAVNQLKTLKYDFKRAEKGSEFESIKQRAFERFVHNNPGSPNVDALAKTTDDRVMLGDAYWKMAEGQHQDDAKKPLLESAQRWYTQALPNVTSNTVKDYVDKQLKEIKKNLDAIDGRRIEAILETRYAKALEPVEKMVAAWDFRGAWAELEEIKFEEKDLAARLELRRDEVRRMGRLKMRMIAKIKAARPPMTKFSLMLRGMNGEVTGADERAVTAQFGSGKKESHAWGELGEKTRARLLELVVDRKSSDDWISAGVLALGCGDTALAEILFEKARSLGAKVDRYRNELARIAFARARELIRKARGQIRENPKDAKQQFSGADTKLAEIEETYATTPWFQDNKKAVDKMRAAAKAGVREAEAEELYAKAAKRFNDNEPFELKPLVEKLNTDYAKTPAVTDANRNPSFAEMERKVKDLGDLLIVHPDGLIAHPDGKRRAFRRIQDAILAVKKPNSVIEIQHNGPYEEEIGISENKKGLTIRGKKGCWPVIKRRKGAIFTVEARDVTLERLIIGSRDNTSLHVMYGPVTLRSCIVCRTDFNVEERNMAKGDKVYMDTCVCLWETRVKHIPLEAKNSVWLRKGIFCENQRARGPLTLKNVVVPEVITREVRCDLQHCTIPGTVRVERCEPNKFVNCIVGQIESTVDNTQIDYCCVGDYLVRAKPGENCLDEGEDPKFANPAEGDYSLDSKSPCKDKASDGGDLGCDFTDEGMKEMYELYKQYLVERKIELRLD